MTDSNPNSWSDWFCFLVDQDQLLAVTFPRSIEFAQGADVASQFQELDSATGGEVEEAIETFAATASWPAMSQEVAAMVRLRIGVAADYIEDLGFAETPYPGTRTFADWIRWLLSEAWEHVGFGRIHGSLEFLRGDGRAGRIPMHFVN
jgi:citrate lyase beta subunit